MIFKSFLLVKVPGKKGSDTEKKEDSPVEKEDKEEPKVEPEKRGRFGLFSRGGTRKKSASVDQSKKTDEDVVDKKTEEKPVRKGLFSRGGSRKKDRDTSNESKPDVKEVPSTNKTSRFNMFSREGSRKKKDEKKKRDSDDNTSETNLIAGSDERADGNAPTSASSKRAKGPWFSKKGDKVMFGESPRCPDHFQLLSTLKMIDNTINL